MSENSYEYLSPGSEEVEREKEIRDPAVSYPTAVPAADPHHVYEPVPPRAEKQPQSGSRAGRLVYNIIRAVLYVAYLAWAAVSCISLWSKLPGKSILQHVSQFALMLFAPAVVIDIVLRIVRRIVYGRQAGQLKRERWALTGLVLILAFIFVVWMLLWKYVVKDLAGI